MDEQRALLDALMGANRNNDQKKKELDDYTDDRVCKFFISGYCPHDMFINTKMDCGSCPKLHSDALKAKYKSSKNPYKYDSILERDFSNRVADIERTIKRARIKVEEEKQVDETVHPEMLKYRMQMRKAADDAEMYGNEGNIDKAYECIADYEVFEKEKAELFLKLTDDLIKAQAKLGIDITKKLRVCDICGSFLSVLDSDRRLADHFMGKQHVGFQAMREFLQAVAAGKRKAAGDKDDRDDKRKSGDKDDRRDRSRDRDDRRRSRARDDRRRSRDRDDRRRSRDRDDRRRSRSRDRNRDRDRDRDRRRY